MDSVLEERIKPLLDAECELPKYLETGDWIGIILHTSLRVRRLYMPWRNGFIFLHELEEDAAQPSSFHKHPGKMWVSLKEGVYEMDVAYGCEGIPTVYESKRIKHGETYYLGERDWHRIRPRTAQTRSVVVVQDWHPPAISNIQIDLMKRREVEEKLALFKTYYFT